MRFRLIKFILVSFVFGGTACSSLPSRPNNDEFTPETNLTKRTPLQVFDYYCSNGKQKRSLKINLLTKLIEPDKANKSLEKYNDELRNSKANMRTAIKNIFLNGRKPKEVSGINGEYTPANLDHETNIYGEFVYPYLSHANYFIGQRKVKLDPEYAQQLYDVDQLKTGYVLRIPVVEQHRLFLGLRTPSIVYGEKESAKLGIGFVFDDTAACLQDGGTTRMSPKCTTHYTSDQALRDQSLAWELIIEKGTQVQESADQEALTYNQSINLDLGIVCAYGLSAEELKAKP